MSLLAVASGVVIDTTYSMASFETYSREIVLEYKVYTSWNAMISHHCHETDEVVAVSNKHMKQKSTIDVEQIKFKPFQNIPAVPSGLEYFFPNLVIFRIPYCNLEKITSNDLRYPKLKYLQLSYNKLTRLDSDLFRNNPLLEFIGLDSNKLTNIGFYILEPMNNLKLIYAAYNACIHETASTPKLIKEMKTMWREKCPQ